MAQTTVSGTSTRVRPPRTRSKSTSKSKTRRRASGRLATALGWLSLGLGLAELVAPRQLAGALGLRKTPRARVTMRAMGLREITTGVGLLVAVNRAPWLWLRVGGDILDMALLGSSLRQWRTNDSRIGAALSAVAGVVALDALAAGLMTRAESLPGVGPEAREVKAVTTINRPPAEVYGFFHKFENLPRFMAHLESIEVLDDKRSRWTVRGPVRSYEWDAEITEERQNELLAWRSLPGGDIQTDGRVEFKRAPGGRGTELHAEIHYRAPAGIVGAAIAKLFGREPGQQARSDLQRLKQVIETGEVARSDASIHKRMHAAKPPTRDYIDRHSSLEAAE